MTIPFKLPNSASKEEKGRVDEKRLCRFMGKLMFILAGCWVIIALGGILEIALLYVTGIVLFIIAIIDAAVYANTGNRFKK